MERRHVRVVHPHRHRAARQARAGTRRIHRRTESRSGSVSRRRGEIPAASRALHRLRADGKSRPRANIEATFDWDDVGSWISVAKYLQPYGEENRANGEITELDSKNNIVFNARPQSRVALLGVEDLIVVQTEDALLVANRHQADAIKNLSPLLPKGLL